MTAMNPTEEVVVKILDLPGDSSSCLPEGRSISPTSGRRQGFLESALEEAYPKRTQVEVASGKPYEYPGMEAGLRGKILSIQVRAFKPR